MDCLITKLKGRVSDDTLPVLGRMYIGVLHQESPSSITQKLVITSSEAQTISVEGGESNLTLDESMSTGWTNSVELEPNIATTFYCKNGDYRLIVPNKYAITGIGKWESDVGGGAISLNIDDFRYSNDFSTLFVNDKAKIYGDLSSMSGKHINILSNLTNITGKISDINTICWSDWTGYTGIVITGNSIVTGDLSELVHTEYSDKLERLSLQRKNDDFNVTGDISVISSIFPNINSLDLSGRNTSLNKISGNIKDLTMPLTTLVIYNSNIEGAIEDFVSTQRTQGRTTGSCNNGGWWGNKITFKGNPIAKSTNDTLSWTATQITCADATITA